MEVDQTDLRSIIDDESLQRQPHLERDWEYAMRREMQEIIPGLFLGPYAAAMKSKLGSLQAAGITHILCIRQTIEANFIRPNFPQHFRYFVLDISDSPTENIIGHFRQTKDFIDDCLNQRGKVLVHGNGGISRSAALVVAYVMEKCSLSCREAISHVRNRRCCISMNEGFLNQLSEYEHIYKAKKLTSVSEVASHTSNFFKRKRMEMDMDAAPQPCDTGDS